jgi:hypothetical protein
MGQDFEVKQGFVLTYDSESILELEKLKIYHVDTFARLIIKEAFVAWFNFTKLTASVSISGVGIVAFFSEKNRDSVSTSSQANIPELRIWTFMVSSFTNTG